MKKSKRVKRCFLVAIVLAIVIASVAATWFVSGYEPRLVVKNRLLSPLDFTPHGDVLSAATLVQDGLFLKPISPIHFISTADGEEVEPPLAASVIPSTDLPAIPRQILHSEFSADGRLLVVVQEPIDLKHSEELEIVVFTRETRERIMSHQFQYSMNAADKSSVLPRRFFSPDSKWLVCVENRFPERSVRVWDLANRNEPITLPKVCYPVFSPDSMTLATTPYWRTNGNEPFSVQLWDVRTGAQRQTFALQGDSEGWNPWPSFSPDGRLIAINSRDNNGKQLVEVFETSSGDRVFQQEAWSPHLLADGKTLLTVKNCDVQLWNTDNWELRTKIGFKLGSHWASGSELTPEPVIVPGKSLVIVADYYPMCTSPFLRWFGEKLDLNAFGSHKIALIDGTSGRSKSIVLRQDSLLSNVAFSSNGTKAAFGSVTGSLSIWEMPPRKSSTGIICGTLLGFAVAGISMLVVKGRSKMANKLPLTESSEDLNTARKGTSTIPVD